MSAPQIPNLLSMGGGGRGGRGGRRGRGGPPTGPGIFQDTPRQLAERKDRLIQATDTDANISRISAVKAGYLKDPFAQEFVLGDTPKRFPIINRGICPVCLQEELTLWLFHADRIQVPTSVLLPSTTLSSHSSIHTLQTGRDKSSHLVQAPTHVSGAFAPWVSPRTSCTTKSTFHLFPPKS